MPGKFHHEELYRGAEKLAALKELPLVICGVGALGSNLAESLARQGFAKLRVIDRDRVEEHNLSTQVYCVADVGAWKVECLRNRVFRASGVELDAVRKEFTPQNARTLLKGAGLVVDMFDNSAARSAVQAHCREAKLPCLHAGLAADYCEVIWDEHYCVPRDVAGDVCDYSLARNIVTLCVSIAAETIVRFALDGTRENWSGTLRDWAVRKFEA